MYEFTGKVKSVGELQTFASGFAKRELVVEEEREGNWPNVVAFAFKKDNVAKLDGVKPGMRVKVGFAVDGREWTDPKTGKVRYSSDLTALRLEQLDGALQVPEPADPEFWGTSPAKGLKNKGFLGPCPHRIPTGYMLLPAPDRLAHYHRI